MHVNAAAFMMAFAAWQFPRGSFERVWAFPSSGGQTDEDAFIWHVPLFSC
jgi:hypothetical protein